VQQQKRSEKPVGALEGRANRWTERKASGEKLPEKEKSVSDLSVLQDGVPRESPLTCLNSVCVSGLSEAQFRGGSHPCISVTLGKSPPPPGDQGLWAQWSKMQGLGKVESVPRTAFLARSVGGRGIWPRA